MICLLVMSSAYAHIIDSPAEGEHVSLQHLHSIVPSICPKSIAHGKLEKSSAYFLLTEFLDVLDYDGDSGTGLSLAQKLAQLHSTPGPIPEGHAQPMFGFPVTTFCGSTPQNNAYKSSWAEFYAKNRLLTICQTIEEHHGSDDELRTWIEKVAVDVVPKLLENGHLSGDRGILPVLVHGDLWSGNKGRGRLGESGPIEDVIFDPSSCYAHSEYEVGIMKMFGGFSASFFNEYHQLLPKTEPQEEYDDRVDLYQL